jgi:uncharacterized RDD family membrane protein YckC
MNEMAGAQDPRTIITPDAFTVAPELLGMPLASPWRRAGAMLVDLVLVAILANAQAVFFAFAVGLFVFWLATRRRATAVRSTARRAARVAFGCLGVLTLTIASLAIWFSLTADADTEIGRIAGSEGREIPITVGGMRDLFTAVSGADSAEAAEAASRLVERLSREEFEPDELRAVVSDMRGDLDPTTLAAVDDAHDRAEAARSESGALDPDTLSIDSLVARYARALAESDSVAMLRFGIPLGEALADASLEERDATIARLESRGESLRRELGETEATLEKERQRGILATVFALLDDVGLGLGWSGLYFTFFLGWWRGRTPGKRLLGVRVVRLDGRAITYWLSFERYGGYAASLFTGLEGFARVLWDRNRQALEDKLAETVVIRDTEDSRRRVAELHARGTAGGSGTRRSFGSRLGFRSGAD